MTTANDMQTLTALLASRLRDLDAGGDAMVRTLEAWSRVNSGSWNLDGLARMGALAREEFRARTGAVHEEIAVAPVRVVGDDGRIAQVPLGPVHHFSVRPECPRRVLLTGHLDTVFGADDPFREPRRIDDETMNGPGVADMKGGVLVMLHALAAFERTPFARRIGWDVLLSCDEEIGSPGSAPVLADFARRADVGLTYEPALADGTLAGARKGSGNFHYLVTGRAAHAGREFEKGRNALVAAARLALALDALNGRREGVTVNPAVMHAGGAPNVVPDRAVLRVNVRVPDEQAMHWTQARLEEAEREIAGLDGIAIERVGGFNRPPKPMTPRLAHLFAFVREAGEALDLDIRWRATGGCCEGNNLWAAGLPNVDTLGVRGGHIHSDREFVVLPSLVERAKLSLLLLAGFAAGLWEDASDAAGRQGETG